MQLSDFTVGKEYEATKRDFEPPDGSPTVQGETIRFTVLDPADASNHQAIGGTEPTAAHVSGWAEFLRVHKHTTDRVHLLHPNTVESAIELA